MDRQKSQKWVDVGLLVFGLALFWFLSHLTGFVWEMSGVRWGRDFFIEPTVLLSFAIAVAVFVAMRKNEVLNNYFNDVVVELTLVHWPERKQTFGSAVVVLMMLGIAAVILFVFDSIWSISLRKIVG